MSRKKQTASKLGRGLSALMTDIATPEKTPEPPTKDEGRPPVRDNKRGLDRKQALVRGGIHEIPIDKLGRNHAQPRKHFDKEKLAELASSIKSKGVLQPILVRPLPTTYGAKGKKISDRYQIVAGERRWHAAQAAGLETIPALIRDLSDLEILEIGVIENVQRADLNPMEEAKAYGALIRQFGRKQAEIAEAIGKSRPHVANCLRLLKLPELAQEYLEDGKITAGHARAILSAPDPQALADAIVQDGLSVRAAERWANTARKALRNSRPGDDVRDANLHAIERKMSQNLGMNVTITHKNPGGTLSIRYKTLEQFDALIKQLNKK
ncbi:MAG: ParB/RepB/Spo0J family partition protein [Robiginitomaculum sp.]|nr:ParB/RepB/Spo0J family partition protein [Robiginitomaculum sp.]